jgi:hypothetical protein
MEKLEYKFTKKYLDLLDVLLIALLLLFPTLSLKDTITPAIIDFETIYFPNLIRIISNIPKIALVPIEIVLSVMHTFYTIFYIIVTFFMLIIILVMHIGTNTTSIDTNMATDKTLEHYIKESENKGIKALKKFLILLKDLVLLCLTWDHGWYVLSIFIFIVSVLTQVFNRQVPLFVKKLKELHNTVPIEESIDKI